MTAETRKGRSHPPARGGRLSPLGELLHRHDRDRYRTALFAPPDRREALFALYAFNYEVARVRESVTQPMLGQIRLQWWREVVEAAYAGTPPRTHEVAQPFAEAIQTFSLSRHHLDRLIDARERDLDDTPPADLAELEDYAEATSASLLCLALEILGVRNAPGDARNSDRGHLAGNAAGTAVHIGIGYALTGLLRAMPFHARAGRQYIPDEISRRLGLDPADYRALRATPPLRAATAEIAAAASRHLQEARARQPALPPAALPALLPAVITEEGLRRLRRVGWNPFDPNIAAPDPLLPWRLFAASLRARLGLSGP